MLEDRFKCYADLASELQKGTDFKITKADRHSPVAIIAPHGGRIEFMTTEIARTIASRRFNFYSFVGLRKRPHHQIHVTSHRFDEPCCLRIISRCRLVVAIHGRRDCDDRRSIFIGGLDQKLKNAIAENLKKSGFVCRISGHKFPATRPTNICNLGSAKKGCQLELPATLRKRLQRNEKLFREFSSSVTRAIETRLSSASS